MKALQINQKKTLTKVEDNKKKNQTKLKYSLKPIIQKIRYAFKHKPVHFKLAKNGRRQIKFIRKIKLIKWE